MTKHKPAPDHDVILSQHTLSRRQALRTSAAMVAALGLAGITSRAGTTSFAASEASPRSPSTLSAGISKPTIVLVHGAWADGSGWGKIIRMLEDGGYTVVAPAVNLESLAKDVSSVQKVITDLQSPALVVGHSYGGAVISGAASGLANVVGLVYIAAFAPDQGENLFGLTGQFTENYGPTFAGQFIRPDGPFDEPQTRVYLDRANFREAFAQDVGKETAQIMAATQRPITVQAFGEPLEVVPAWRQVRSWYQVSTRDRVIQPEAERWMAQRIGANTIELPASHAAHVSYPTAITRLIKTAAKASER
jgi:pimeloyl-ACP methyl ester carboxylesterase